MQLSQRLEECDWVPRARVLPLRRLGIETVEQLLTHFPRRHEDRREFAGFPREESDTPICICGEVVKTSVRRFGGWKKIFEVTLEQGGAHALSQPLVLRWFNLHYVQKMIAEGQQVVAFGKPRLRGQRICMEHPEFEVIESDAELSIHFGRITPIYPATEGLPQRAFRELVYHALENLDEGEVETLLPRNIDPGGRRRALSQIHFPDDDESLKEAREHLVFSEFFEMQMSIASRRAALATRTGSSHADSGEMLEIFLRALPFDFTDAQARVLAEVRRDLGSTRPMNRLLQGDVGSGKTVVAIGAMLLAVEAGFQAALMAPTQILAEQHYAVLCRWLEPLGIRLALRTGARHEESAPLPLFREPARAPSGDAEHRRVNNLPLRRGSPSSAAPIPDDAPQIVIGTHALLYEGVSFANLGLVVIDEQHKFGVSQRARLTAREPVPDVLVMTATPIPRTLTMTVYGDLDVSTIDEMPSNRGKIITALRDSAKIGDVLTFLRSELGAGRQAYVVYPLIDESEKLDAKAAAAEFETWCERLRPYKCELLHGRIAAPEKQAIMERFRRGETSVLISTTVIEVGVDVANATMMLIENAERFGLAQLHQLRGRIGRGEHKSYCVLLTSDKTPETMSKLSVLEKTSNGFEVAEADWEQRGPGDLLGTAQSGLAGLKLGNLKTDFALMQRARAAANAILEWDPKLEAVENQRFRRLVVEQEGRTFSNVS